jgi:hypothetical protein
LITGTPNGNTYINPSPLDNWNSQRQYIYKPLPEGRGLYMYYRWEFQLSREEGFIYVLPLGVPVIKRRGVYICIAVGSSSYQEGRGLYMYYRWEFQLSRGEGFINWNSHR